MSATYCSAHDRGSDPIGLRRHHQRRHVHVRQERRQPAVVHVRLPRHPGGHLAVHVPRQQELVGEVGAVDRFIGLLVLEGGAHVLGVRHQNLVQYPSVLGQEPGRRRRAPGRPAAPGSWCSTPRPPSPRTRSRPASPARGPGRGATRPSTAPGPGGGAPRPAVPTRRTPEDRVPRPWRARSARGGTGASPGFPNEWWSTTTGGPSPPDHDRMAPPATSMCCSLTPSVPPGAAHREPLTPRSRPVPPVSPE